MSEEQKKETVAKIDKYKAARKRILFEAYSAYTRAATLLDKEGKMTEESIWTFKEKFESNARIVNDIQLSTESELIDANTYADLVSTYMRQKGVITEFDKRDINAFFKGGEEQYSPRIDNSEEGDDIFFYTVKTTKRNYNILNKKNQVLFYDEAMEYPIKITFRISINDDRAQIVSILPDN